MGTAEIPEIKINQMGTIADSNELQRLRRAREAEKYRQNNVTVIRESSGQRGQKAHVKRRLDAYEDAVDRATPPDPSGVTVIKNNENETNTQRARRLNTQAQEIGY